VERPAAPACYLQALCRHLLKRNEPMPEQDDYLVYSYNRFRACRFGLDGMMVNPKTCEQISIREDILATLRKLELHAVALGAHAALVEVERCAARDGSHATYLRKCHAETGGVEGVVRAAVDALRNGPQGYSDERDAPVRCPRASSPSQSKLRAHGAIWPWPS